MMGAAAFSGHPGDGRWSDVRAYVGRTIELPEAALSIKQTLPEPSTVTLRNGGTQALDLDARSQREEWAILEAVVQEGQPAEQIRVVFVAVGFGLAAGAGALLVTFALPFLFMPGRSPWYQLLSEGEAGLSLARVQLLLWFAPALFIYAALSIPLLRLAPLDPTLSVLLGLGGFTALIGTAASKPAAAAAPAVPEAAATQQAAPPSVFGSLTDLVTDFQNQTDFTRYQYLTLSVFGSVSLFIAFVGSMTMPTVPKEFLYMIAASQTAYVGTKAVKASKT
jgi:hypothetical protein